MIFTVLMDFGVGWVNFSSILELASFWPSIHILTPHPMETVGTECVECT